MLLHHYMGEIDGVFRAWGFAKGGNGSVSAAIAAAARAFGAEIRTQAPVAQVLVQNGRAVGVVLESGEEIRAKRVVSGADPRRTFMQLVGAQHLPARIRRGDRALQVPRLVGQSESRARELPNFTCLPGDGPHLRGAISISPSIDYLERAYDDAKYGEFSRRPYMDIVIPSMIDPGMAPPGKHVMSIFVQYAPYHVNGGWTDAKREAFGDTVIDTLAEYAPNLKSAILHRQVITPADIERIVGLTEGNIFQGELTLQQMFFPAAGAGVGEIQDAHRRPLPVRLGHASGRRRDGRVGAQRGGCDPEGTLVSLAAIVIGAGVDELVAAHYLRRAGHRVLVIDEHNAADAHAVDIGAILPRIVRDLALRGLTIDRRDLWATVALPDGGLLGLSHDMARSTEAIRKVSAKDASRWPVFCERMHASRDGCSRSTARRRRIR